MIVWGQEIFELDPSVPPKIDHAEDAVSPNPTTLVLLLNWRSLVEKPSKTKLAAINSEQSSRFLRIFISQITRHYFLYGYALCMVVPGERSYLYIAFDLEGAHMPVFEGEHSIQQRLQDLADALELEDAEPIDMLICGGAALSVMGFVSRATDDIDVLALVLDEKDVAAKPFPQPLQEATRRVARARGLPDEWLNPGPADMQHFGLPEGIVERAEKREYGALLTARFLARYDQIHLKLYAVVDQSGGKHLSDLHQLNPSPEELVDAVRWCFTQDLSSGFRQVMQCFLTEEGHDDVLERIS